MQDAISESQGTKTEYEYELGCLDEFGDFLSFITEVSSIPSYPVSEGAVVRVNLSEESYLVYLVVDHKGYLTYAYGEEEISFRCTLLSEVGATVRPSYESYFASMKHEIDVMELDHYPWLQEFIKNFPAED